MSRQIIQTMSAEQTHEFAKEIAKQLGNGGVLLLFGDLGAGKTTFTQGLAKELGIVSHIISPTFLLMRTYEIPSNPEATFSHIDLYRIDQPEEIKDLGIQDIMNEPKNIVVIEWAERMKGLYPDKRIELHFTYLNETSREIRMEQYD